MYLTKYKERRWLSFSRGEVATHLASSDQNLGPSCTEFSEGVAMIGITIARYFFIKHVSRSARLLPATGLISWAVVFTNSHPG
jgi:hypothetical protein